jgi:Hemolysin coregulated protein Hcp (TssD)
MPSFKATFKLDGNEYDVISCVYSFGQATDEKGRPASDVQGGNISVQFSEDGTGVIGWMIDPYAKKSGSIVFNKPDQASTLKEVKFEDAYCVGYSESFNANSASAMIATVNISARKISVGDTTLEKKW